jgi:hypothetical protein
MKLINCESQPLAIEDFIGSAIPPYAILSHTWEDQEVTYQQFAETQTRTTIKGWHKIQKACELAQIEGYNYLWIDSCCIDKSSSAELSEAINSMFEWYLGATVCFAYLSDYDTPAATTSYFCNARWFSRGWTLQELIAPLRIFFFDKTWALIGTKADLCYDISKITGVDVEVLCPPGNASVRDLLDDLPVAKRLAWASKRATTRIEDQSYCLLGIFGINMPMIYGEGSRAFIRLQEEILRVSNDTTLFAWTEASLGTEDDRSRPLGYRRLLANSPAEFSSVISIVSDLPEKFKPDYAMSNKGLRIRASLKRTEVDDLLVMPIHCHSQDNPDKTLGIILKHQGGGVYVRARSHALSYFSSSSSSDAITPSEIFIVRSITATAASKLSTVHRNAFCFQFQFPKEHLQLAETKPRHLWDAEQQMFITDGIPNFTAFHRFVSKNMTTKGTKTAVPVTYSCVVACGFSGNAKVGWATIGSEGDSLYNAAIAGNLAEVSRIGTAEGALQSGTKTVKKAVSKRYGSLGNMKLECQRKVLRGEPVIYISVGL